MRTNIKAEDRWILCKHCIAAIKSRGERVLVGDHIWEDEAEEEGLICEWCEDEMSIYELYECL